MGKRYSKAEDDYIHLNYQRHTYFDIGLAINRDPRSVRERALLMGLKKFNRKNWSSDECITLLANSMLSNRELATMLGRNRRSVAAKRAWLINQIDVLNDTMRPK
jgi:hypothetical protein